MSRKLYIEDAARTMRGSELSPGDQKAVLSAYVHRFTKDHRPQWARLPLPNGNPVPVQFESDSEWLAHTRFAVTERGTLDGRISSCHSSPTWPDNPELRTK